MPSILPGNHRRLNCRIGNPNMSKQTSKSNKHTHIHTKAFQKDYKKSIGFTFSARAIQRRSQQKSKRARQTQTNNCGRRKYVEKLHKQSGPSLLRVSINAFGRNIYAIKNMRLYVSLANKKKKKTENKVNNIYKEMLHFTWIQ